MPPAARSTIMGAKAAQAAIVQVVIDGVAADVAEPESGSF